MAKMRPVKMTPLKNMLPPRTKKQEKEHKAMWKRVREGK